MTKPDPFDRLKSTWVYSDCYLPPPPQPKKTPNLTLYETYVNIQNH